MMFYTLFHYTELIHSMAQIVSSKNEKLSNMQLVERVFAVLGALATTEGANVTQIAQQTGLAKSTVSRICATLEQLNMVERRSPQELGGRGFKIGRGLVALTAHVPQAQALTAIAQPYLQQLQEAIGESVALTLPEGDNAYVVIQITSQQAIQMRDWTGVRIPLYVQSTGRVFLAERPAEGLERYLQQPLLPYTNKTIGSPAELQRVLAQVRAQGYAWVFEEFEEGLAALAAPVRDTDGRVMAAVNVFGPTFRFPAPGQQATVTHLTMQTARQIATRWQDRTLGHAALTNRSST
jgi:DNA-binding IclR family transcriptional regulator